MNHRYSSCKPQKDENGALLNSSGIALPLMPQHQDSASLMASLASGELNKMEANPTASNENSMLMVEDSNPDHNHVENDPQEEDGRDCNHLNATPPGEDMVDIESHTAPPGGHHIHNLAGLIDQSNCFNSSGMYSVSSKNFPIPPLASMASPQTTPAVTQTVASDSGIEAVTTTSGGVN